MQGSFNVWTDHKKGHSKVKDLARFKPMQRHLFLHEKAVLFCKKREENGEGYEKAPSYSYKHSLNVRHSAVQERSDAKGLVVVILFFTVIALQFFGVSVALSGKCNCYCKSMSLCADG